MTTLLRRRSLLHYPGGKSQHKEFIIGHFPRDEKTIYSPFFGGGSVELYYATTQNERFRDCEIVGNDAETLVTDFWECMCDSALREEMLREIRSLLGEEKTLTKDRFFETRATLLSPMELSLAQRGAYFYVVSRNSYHGGGLFFSSYSKTDATRFQNRLQTLFRLSENEGVPWNKIRVHNMDYLEFLKTHVPSDGFLFLDPPYEICHKVLYGRNGNLHRSFDPLLLRDTLLGPSATHTRWLLCYNDVPEIREMYRECKMISFGHGS